MTSLKLLRPLCALALVLAARLVFAQPPLPPGIPHFSIPDGEKPRGLVVADFNGDGKPDIATGNQTSNSVTVLLAVMGGFKPAPGSPIKVGNGPRTPVCADFNGDGKLDMVVPNSEGAGLSILLGDGTGTFAPAPGSPMRVAGRPMALAVADFDGNGKPDVAVANNSTNSVSILLGKGDGTFAMTGAPLAVGQTPFHIETADCNGDKIPDLVVANYGSHSVSVLLGKGGGAFATKVDFQTGPSPRMVTVADFNGDKILDLAVANVGANEVSLLRGDGRGGFGPKMDYMVGSQPRCVAVADFNRDGWPDMAIANEGSDSVSILLNNGAGGFTTALMGAVKVGAHPSFVSAADFNGDGVPDLAVANSASNDVSILRGNGSGGFRPYR